MFLHLQSFSEGCYCLLRLEQYQKEEDCELSKCYFRLEVGTLANDV